MIKDNIFKKILKCLWKLIGRCSFCGCRDVSEWDDVEFTNKTKQSHAFFGYMCKKCYLVTIEKREITRERDKV